MKPKYDAAYFIEKFKEIPDEKWCMYVFYNLASQCCALGHCGAKESAGDTLESDTLYELFEEHGINVVSVNDGKLNDRKGGNYTQKTPKERVLAALEDIESGKI